MATVDIEGKDVKLTNLDKVWWPEEGITKGDVIRYYIAVAPWLLPHLYNRPLVLTRYPDGPYGNNFYQKNTPDHAPEWLQTVELPSEKRIINYCLANDLASLVWVINSGAFEIHPFLSSVATIDYPDYVVFDLDPMEKATWQDICQIALLVRQALDHWGLVGYPKTSGATGLQIYVPLVAEHTYEEVRDFALALCQGVEAALPDKTTLERKVAKRQGKLYLDYLQNVKGKTLASVYGVRPRPQAPVSTPLAWEEVEEMRIRPSDFTIHNVPQRLAEKGDLFAAMQSNRQTLKGILAQLSGKL